MADESGAAVCANPPSQTLAVVRATRQQLWPPGARVPLFRPLGRESLVLATFAPPASVLSYELFSGASQAARGHHFE